MERLTTNRHARVAVDSMRCSFCHKAQDVVGKLISSPSDYPRAYICDECITVCNTILEDDRGEVPLTIQEQVLEAVADWIHKEAASEDATGELDQLRALARQMMELPDTRPA